MSTAIKGLQKLVRAKLHLVRAPKAGDLRYSYAPKYGEFHVKDAKRFGFVMAVCDRESDAEDIVDALNYAETNPEERSVTGRGSRLVRLQKA